MLKSQLRAIIRDNLSVVLQYDPYERFEGVTTKDHFLKLIKNDPAFSPFFLHNSKYATARVGGNLITSLHRKLGDMYEDIFKVLLKESLKVPTEDLNFAVQLNIDGELQQRSTDGLIRFSRLAEEQRDRIVGLLKAGKQVGLGVAFEVRSCYQIGDSKRIQADRDMSIALKNAKIIPVMLIFCTTSLRSPVDRLSKHWNLFEGQQAFNAVRTITGFDLYEFLLGESKTIEPLMKKIFEMM